jgi:hypothetical protein
MPDSTCPKCRAKGNNALSCDSCGLVFSDYENNKQAAIGEVYSLISARNLTKAKTLAEKLADDYPGSKGEFVLLLSNINRDINIEKKITQATRLFDQGKFDDVTALLRNIKAFDPALEEKIISLRKKALRHNEHDDMIKQAAQKFNAGQYGKAKTLFQAIHDSKRQDQAEEYLKKIAKKEKEMLKQAVQCLEDNLFDAAEKSFKQLHTQFPEMEQQTADYTTLIQTKKRIKEDILSAADRAKNAGRSFEAKILYSYLGWQYPEFRPRIGSYLNEEITKAVTSLTDRTGDTTIDFSALGLQLNEHGLFEPAAAQKKFSDTSSKQSGGIIPVPENPDPVPDKSSKPINLQSQQVTDFTC